MLPSGIKVCSFGVAINRFFKDKDGMKQEATDFENVTAFGKIGELAGQYLKKGQQVLVEGRLQTRSWESNGEKKYRTEIIADNIQFGPKASGNYQKSANTVGTSSETPGLQSQTEPQSGEVGGELTGGAVEKDNKIEYPSEEINPDDIPF